MLQAGQGAPHMGEGVEDLLDAPPQQAQHQLGGPLVAGIIQAVALAVGWWGVG